jgi:hypothetical protein
MVNANVPANRWPFCPHEFRIVSVPPPLGLVLAPYLSPLHNVFHLSSDNGWSCHNEPRRILHMLAANFLVLAVSMGSHSNNPNNLGSHSACAGQAGGLNCRVETPRLANGSANDCFLHSAAF